MMDLQTLGNAAALYQRDPRIIETALDAVAAQRALAAKRPIPQRAAPVLRLNGIPYYTSAEISDAINFLQKLDAKKQAEVEANV